MTIALILGALAGQVDAVDALNSRGVEVHVCAHVRNGPGVDAADAFHVADIVDPEQVAAIARKIQADVVYSVGSDIAMPTVVQVSEQLGLPHFHGVELTDTFRRKQHLRNALGDAGVSPVRYSTIGPEEPTPPWTVFPGIVKPVDAQGQRGITVVHDEEQLPEAIDEARAGSVSGAVILEEFLVGPEVSAHVLVSAGKVILFVPSDRHVWPGPMVGVPEAHSLPLRASTRESEDEFQKLAEGVVDALGVQDGPLYIQAIFTADGPRIVEVASRLDGCHLWRLLKVSTGIDIMDAVLGRLLGEDWPDFPSSVEAEPATLAFLLDHPDTVADEEYVRRAVREDAVYWQLQTDHDGRARRTNDVVSRIGYQIYRGL